MKIYIVGGWVRDRLIHELLGRPDTPSDRDFVVVGATADELLKKGFIQVGADFPVFLHPVTHEEYALARVEKKSGRGYLGFETETKGVTLEEDLMRRDLTVNAVAFDGKNYIDPFGGIADIRAMRLRHVSAAFSEDPVRVLRCARFAAQLPGFQVAPGTMGLMRSMVASGETDALTGERIYKEFSKTLNLADPSPFFSVLSQTGFFARVFPEVEKYFDTALLKKACQAGLPLQTRFAALLRAAPPDASENFLSEIRAPKETFEFSLLFAKLGESFGEAPSPEGFLSLFTRSDAFRKTERFYLLCRCAGALYGADTGTAVRGLEVLKALPAGEIAKRCAKPSEIPGALRQARLARLETFLKEGK